MEEFDEDLIWDTIMESGQSRIDYDAFSAFFPFRPDNFLSSVIYGFAMDRSPDAIAGNIAAQVSQTGNAVSLQELTAFIEESRAALNLESELTSYALAALARGADPEGVFQYVKAGLLGPGGEESAGV